jgi:lipoprotein-anchoring transpeptidase ErfK/SrfK
MSRAPRQPRARSAAAQAAAGAGLGLAVVLLWPAFDSSPREMPLGAPAASAVAVPRPERLGQERHVSVWSTVRRAARARSAPERTAPVVARVETRTPEGTDNTLLILDRAADRHGRVWVRARLPVLPAGTTGWLPREAIGGYRFVRTRLVVDLRRLRATLLRNGRRIFRAPVGVGQPRWPTPRGRFYIRNKLVRYRSSFYGPLAFGTSARSGVLTDWPGGGFVGIHGTDRPKLLPGRVSHGCIRMRNPDIVRLGRLMPVGTPLTIR